MRAEIEHQLRRLTKAQQHLEAVSFSDTDRDAETAALVSEIDQIIEATMIVREQAITALGEARSLQNTVAARPGKAE